jgi:hypothetical protein
MFYNLIYRFRKKKTRNELALEEIENFVAKYINIVPTGILETILLCF